ncbi:MAG: EAL domain-containing protein, partial [Burkholderiaceae bacterium]
VSPGEFIPIAEKSGVIAQIGLWSLEQACRQLVAWQACHDAARSITVAVNVSMRQLFQPSFLDDVTDVILRTGVAPESIELELTETSVMANPMQTIENLERLKQLGLRLALDDFGIGYSSLAYLQKLPIDVLKIDQLFVRGLGTSHSDTAIVRLIATLAKTLDLEVVAEGVENVGHITELRKMGCHLVQGFAFSPALSADAAETLIAAGHAYPFASALPCALDARNASAPA